MRQELSFQSENLFWNREGSTIGMLMLFKTIKWKYGFNKSSEKITWSNNIFNSKDKYYTCYYEPLICIKLYSHYLAKYLIIQMEWYYLCEITLEACWNY